MGTGSAVFGNGSSEGGGERVRSVGGGVASDLAALRVALRAALSARLSLSVAVAAARGGGATLVLKAALGAAYLECLLILWLNRDDDSGPRDEE